MKRLMIALVIVLLVGPPLYVELFPVRHERVVIPRPPEGTYRLYVAEWGYHTSIILEQPAGSRLGPPGREDAAFVEYAWGDRSFYMESNYWPHAVFATVLLPTSSVAYIAAWDADVERAANARSLFRRDLSATELHALLTSLEATMERDDSGERLAAFPPVRGHRGRFYPAHGAYIWTSNCNRWTVERLAAAGLAGGSGGVVFSTQVAGRLREFERVRAPR